MRGRSWRIEGKGKNFSMSEDSDYPPHFKKLLMHPCASVPGKLTVKGKEKKSLSPRTPRIPSEFDSELQTRPGR